MTETILIVNALTNEETIRTLTADEIADRKAAQAEYEAQTQDKADARQSALAKLADLGLTADEIAAL